MKLSHRISRFLRQRILVVLIILLQIAFVTVALVRNTRNWELLAVLFGAISFFVALYVVNSRDQAAYKTTLVFLILCFPIFGGLFYILFKGTVPHRAMHKKLLALEEQLARQNAFFSSARDEAVRDHPDRAGQIRYLCDHAGFPVVKNGETRYFSSGEDALPAILAEIRKAKRYVFLEYFIIKEGEMWDQIASLLEEKAAAGVDVRVLYDDMGCFRGLDGKSFDEAGYRGIQFLAFNRFVPLLTTIQNNRDHRKILVVDGKVAFTGGINIADEYINRVERFGHWKDAALMVRGDAAWCFAVMFLQMWSFCAGRAEIIADYLPRDGAVPPQKGYVLPYTDSPMDRENVGEHVYLQMINLAKNYLYITTPYLIIDDSTVSALTLAAKSGVDVRIITPYRYDKFLVHMTTRSYYKKLIAAGVRIYEYSPGFMHAKLFVSDDEVATVGTANLDFRSLYLHFECGTVLYGADAVIEVREDFLKILSVCHEVTENECQRGLFVRIVQAVLRLFAPLM